MANKKINELSTRTPSLSDLMLVGDPSSGYSYKCTITSLATIIETDIADGYVTLSTAQTISGAKTFSNNLTLTSVSNAGVDTDKFLVLNGSNVVNFRTGSEVLSDIGGQGALTLTTTGTSGAATLVGNTLNIPQYQGVITLTTTGSSGSATLVGNTLNVPTYTAAGLGAVTSVGLSTGTTGTDVNVSGSPITSSGTITLNIPTASATNTGKLSSTDWSTFNNKQNAITLTTTGTSGAATLVGSTLNIPQYQSVLTNPVTGTGTTNYLPKFTGASTIGNSLVYEGSFAIGIGTITPFGGSSNYTALDIRGTVGGIIALGNTSNSITGRFLELSATSSNAQIYALNSAPLSFGTESLSRLSIDTSGNITISVIANATTDTDKFLVSDSGVIKYRTGAEVLSDIGGQAALTNPVTGTGLANQIPKFTGTTTLSNSQITDNGTSIGVGLANPNAAYLLDVYGNANVSNTLNYSVGLTKYASTSASSTAMTIEALRGIYISFATGSSTTATERVRIANDGNVTFSVINNATTDTDRFLVSDSGVLKYRTGSEVLSDIGAAASTSISGTTNYIPKFTSSSAIGNSIAQDDGTTFTIGGELYVNRNDAPAIRVARSGGTNANTVIQFQNATTSNYIGSNGTLFGLGGTTGSVSAQALIIEPSSSEKMRLDASGNLGLGTSSPSAKLEIVGSQYIKTGNELRFYRTDNAIYTRLYDAGSYFALDNRNGNGFDFQSAGTSQMRLDASGNLGLGVTPSAMSAVSGIELVQGSQIASRILANVPQLYISSNIAGDSYAPTYKLNGYATQYRLQGYDGTHAWYTAPSGTAGNAISFTQAMTLDASGRLGIGTTSPQRTLDVIGSSNDVPAASFGRGLSIGNWSGIGFGYVEAGNSNYRKAALVFERTGGAAEGKIHILNNNTADISSASLADARLTILPAGNVGIGTTSPAALTEINPGAITNGGAAKFALAIRSGGTTYLDIYQGFNSTIAGQSILGSTLVSSDALAFATNYTERMRITSGGNVLVGRTTNAAAGWQMAIKDGLTVTDGTYEVQLFGYFGAGVGTYTNHDFTFRTNNTEKMRITSGGELLINTQTDAGDYKLQVNGNGYFTGSVTTNGNFNLPASGVLTAQSSGATIYIHAGATYPGGTIESVGGSAGANAGNLIFRTGTGTGLQTEALKLDASQNAFFAGSIKTAAPSSGTAKPWKLGAATVTSVSHYGYAQVEIDGVVYYVGLVTAD